MKGRWTARENAMIKILSVEDDRLISRLLEINLSDAGYNCTCVYDGLAAADLLEKERFDLILLDIMLPEIDGYELLDYIKTLETPVIFLTAKGDVEDRVRGLKLGAEDYIVKPFVLVELLARIEVVLRRFKKTETVYTFENITVDMQKRCAFMDGHSVDVTPKELDLLVLFIKNVNIALFRNKIFELVWGGDYEGDTRTVDIHVQRIRKKFCLEGRLKTIYKVGYRLEQ